MLIALEYKRQANEAFKKASRISDPKDPKYTLNLRESCVLYGRSIEEVGAREFSIFEGDRVGSKDLVELQALKPQLFLNLAMANARLGDYAASRQCCNVAIYFCNEIFTPLSDLPEINLDIDVLIPVVI